MHAPTTRELAHLLIDLAELNLELGAITLSALDDLNAAVSNLGTQVSAENTALTTIHGQLVDVSAQLAALQGQGTLTPADLEPVIANIANIANSAADATQAATGTTPAPPPTGTPPPTPSPTTTAASTDDLDRTVYTFSGDPSTVDTTVWLVSGYMTPDNKPLFFFSGDTAKGDNNGDGQDGGAWVRYVGPVVAVEQSTAV